jgi:rifampin ADP-ribosylating transferase
VSCGPVDVAKEAEYIPPLPVLDRSEAVVEDGTDTTRTMTIAEAIEASRGAAHIPVTYETCGHVEGPFFHGTRVAFAPGDELVPGHGSNYHDGRVANHVYFAALVEPAVWGAELAVALAEHPGRGHVYVVEPTGPFEDDPNVTNKRCPGNVTRSYRTRRPIRILRELEYWEGHPPEVLEAMVESLARLREEGLDAIDD